MMSLSPAELVSAKKVTDKYHLRVSDIASPIYKWDLPEIPAQASSQRDTFRADFAEKDAKELLKKVFSHRPVVRRREDAHLQLLARGRAWKSASAYRPSLEEGCCPGGAEQNPSGI